MLKAIERQPKFVFEDVSGTLIGFRCPEYLQGVNVAGFHVHFITEDRCGGGHVLAYTLLDGKIEVAKVSNLRIDLPQTEDFANATLHSDELEHAIREAEG
ncbi:acetolactate decarboxylase [Paraburkholderia sp. RL17-337-BIB-A]|uniref:acetolactate decarboxylase n=1 Tax=Paraburkholderia sp. RL17-337-BIB-A TaxID=3031636 RepID=UPI0038BA8233